MPIRSVAGVVLAHTVSACRYGLSRAWVLATYGIRMPIRSVAGDVQILLIGDMAVGAMPGELFPEIGAAVKKASPFAVTTFCGYSTGKAETICARGGKTYPSNHQSISEGSVRTI